MGHCTKSVQLIVGSKTLILSSKASQQSKTFECVLMIQVIKELVTLYIIICHVTKFGSNNWNLDLKRLLSIKLTFIQERNRRQAETCFIFLP